MSTLKSSDYIAAAVPTFASITLSDLNVIVSILGTTLGIAYLLWKWRREAKK